jgi:hypothetical protein
LLQPTTAATKVAKPTANMVDAVQQIEQLPEVPKLGCTTAESPARVQLDENMDVSSLMHLVQYFDDPARLMKVERG